MLRHVIRFQDFDRKFLEDLFKHADVFREMMREKDEAKRRQNRVELKGRLHAHMLFEIFYEPSTRTRISFAAAAKHLGMDAEGTEAARLFSSVAKGESLPDNIRVLCGYHPDVIVLRHDETGASEIAAQYSTVPIINGGDGRGQHPTQGFLDLYTIKQEFGRIDGLTVAIGGDLANGRTSRSLAYNLSKFDNVRLILVAPKRLAMGDDIKAHLLEYRVKFEETQSLEYAMREADVVYWTRIQKERLGWLDWLIWAIRPPCYIIGKHELNLAKRDMILMHPLPRRVEISTKVDDDPRAAYFRQAENGLYIRMALLEWVLGKW
ncbi:MAG: aspartate carbamoyltransferase [Candidatus Sungbacteria bacterium]|nr:aspartate carbamoyltransferase [Candidatus Sungbacteria bacterium]